MQNEKTVDSTQNIQQQEKIFPPRIKKFMGKSVVVAKFVSANEKSAFFNIAGTTFEIYPIESNENFLSPLERNMKPKEGEEVKADLSPLTMEEYLCHPRKSDLRKFKEGDNVLLILQRFSAKDEVTKKDYLFFLMQNAIIFSRKYLLKDDYEFHGFAIDIDNLVEMKKHKTQGFSSYVATQYGNEKNFSELFKNIEELLKHKAILGFIRCSFKKQNSEEYSNYSFAYSKEDIKRIQNNISNEENENNKEIDPILLDEMKTILEKEFEGNKNLNFYFNFWIYGSKKNNLFEDKKQFFNNMVNIKTNNVINKEINETIRSFYEHPIIQDIENNQTYKEKILFQHQYDVNRFEKIPVILCSKETYNDKEESFFVINSIVPNVIKIRNIVTKRIKEQNNSQNQQEN
jgi:hypothetical protein